jgi:hypothetical protein
LLEMGFALEVKLNDQKQLGEGQMKEKETN